MRPISITNDDLGTFVARKRRWEVYRHSTDLEIIQRERDKMDFFLACYIGVALCAAFALGVNHTHIGHLVPWLPVLWGGAYFIIRQNRRLDGFLGLLASRSSLEREQNG